MTRRARNLRSRADVEAYRKGRMLPVELLQPVLAEKVWPQFLRGDHDVAIFQAFKEIEVAVRTAANGKGAGYPNDLVGITLMRKAFHPDSGPLTDVSLAMDVSLVMSEREAEMHLGSADRLRFPRFTSKLGRRGNVRLRPHTHRRRSQHRI